MIKRKTTGRSFAILLALLSLFVFSINIINAATVAEYQSQIDKATTVDELSKISSKIFADADYNLHTHRDKAKDCALLQMKCAQKKGDIYKAAKNWEQAKAAYEYAKNAGEGYYDIAALEKSIEECNKQLGETESTSTSATAPTEKNSGTSNTADNTWEDALNNFGRNPTKSALDKMLSNWINPNNRTQAEDRLSLIRDMIRANQADQVVLHDLVAQCWQKEAEIAMQYNDYDTAGDKYRVAEREYRDAGNKGMGNDMEDKGDAAYEAAKGKTSNGADNEGSATSPSDNTDEGTRSSTSGSDNEAGISTIGDTSDESETTITSSGNTDGEAGTDESEIPSEASDPILPPDSDDSGGDISSGISGGGFSISICIPGMGTINISGSGAVSIRISIGCGSVKISVCSGIGSSSTDSQSSIGTTSSSGEIPNSNEGNLGDATEPAEGTFEKNDETAQEFIGQ